MSQIKFQNNNTQPMENIISLFKDFVLACRLSPELNPQEKKELKSKILEILEDQEINLNIIDKVLES
jgi:hypothetical protein